MLVLKGEGVTSDQKRSVRRRVKAIIVEGGEVYVMKKKENVDYKIICNSK